MSAESSKPGDGFVRAGVVVFIIGAVSTVATFIPLFLDLTRLPTAAYWMSMLMPVGLLLALIGVLRSARSQHRRATSAG